MKINIDNIVHSIVNVQPMEYSGQIFSMNPKYSRNTITYRYLESSDQHIFNTNVPEDEYFNIYNWCIENFSDPGSFSQNDKQWCHEYKKFTFFSKKEADIFALRWL
jgi:hypothetical protein